MRQKDYLLQALILLIVAVICLSGCRSSKSATTSEYERTEDNKKQQKIETLTQSKLNIEGWYNSVTSGIINFRIYDTSKVDSLGNHPVLADGNAVIDNRKEGGSKEQKNDSIKTNIEATESNEVSEFKSEVTTAEKEATPVLKESKNLVIWICVLVVLLFIAWLVYKRRNK